MVLIRRLLGLVVLITLLSVGIGAAQEGAGDQLTGVAAEQQANIAKLTSQVDRLDKDIDENIEDDARLVEIRLALEDIQSAVLKSGVAFRPTINDINTKLNALGPVPKEGQPPEPDDKATQRAALNAQKAQINHVIGQAEDLLVRVNGLVNKVSTARRDLFANTLMKRYQLRSAIGPDVGKAVEDQVTMLSRNVAAWFRFVVRFKLQAALAATFFASLVGGLSYFFGRRVIARLLHKDPEANPDYLHRLSAAFWSTLFPSLALGLFLGLTLGLYQSYNVLRGDISNYFISLLQTLFTSFFVNRLATSILSPDAPNWRLVRIEAGPARILIWLATVAALVVGLDRFTGIITESLGSPLSVTILKGLVAALLVGVLLLVFGSIRPFADKDGAPQPWPTWFRGTIYAIGAATILASLTGYISLAQFVSRQIVVTGAWIATAYIGLLASRAISDEGAFAHTTAGRWFRNSYNTEASKLDQLGVLTSVVINLLIVVVFLPVVLFQWGFQAGDIAVWMRRLGSGFQIGTFVFSPLAIITGLIIFGVGYFITRWFQSWIDDTVMARGRVDPGVRNSIRTVVGYAGMALAALVAISAAGLNLSNLALIAGGLSLGIGFGLQNVVSNFVSGLILLVERPFKVGDWVVAGDVSGTVRKISVRATEIETFQRQTVILPNSQLINNAVGNWTHRNRLGRIDVPVAVAYGADVEHVHAILLDLARNNPLVLKNPEPFVLFAGFADTSINFEIRVFLADISNGSVVQNELRFGLVKAFEQEGIELAHVPRPELAGKRQLPLGDPVDTMELPSDDMQSQAKGRKRKPDPS
ncbi:MAG: mechanosensitive ion channel family protein [Rhizobiaceae bacterium]|nr:mechanosensitive ion channel family protein [Rhizobiaceae bacterium]